MANVNLQVEHRTEPWGVLLTVRGSAGVTNLSELDRHILPIVASKPALVVLDASGLEFISSLGIGSFTTLHRGLKPSGQLRIAGANANVRAVFERTKLTTLLALFDSVEDALRG
ncbi:MAG TPA: hypothetical protein DEB06_07830 [Phycisphaerales bacterium]|nr:hypothetical protein [Phycisphaerales bacterium]